jgi:hypothetical protein
MAKRALTIRTTANISEAVSPALQRIQKVQIKVVGVFSISILDVFDNCYDVVVKKEGDQ